jgi:hypothetical protein
VPDRDFGHGATLPGGKTPGLFGPRRRSGGLSCLARVISHSGNSKPLAGRVAR